MSSLVHMVFTVGVPSWPGIGGAILNSHLARSFPSWATSIWWLYPFKPIHPELPALAEEYDDLEEEYAYLTLQTLQKELI